MAQTFNTILSFVKSTSRKDRRKGVGSLSVSAVAGGGVGSAADSATQAWVRDNFVDKTTEQEISALKIFSQGIKIGDVLLFKHPDGYVYLDETLVLKGGVVMYGNGSGAEVPSIFDSLPIDGETIKRNANKELYVDIDGITIKRDGNGALYVDETALSVSGGGGGGGVADSVHWNNVIGKPSWIGSTKPTYKYSEIEERPDLSVYAKLTDIPSLNGYATQTWVENKGYLLATTASDTYQPKITSSNKLAYSLISGTPTIPTKLSQLTDDLVVGNYLSTKGGTISGSITATSFIGNLTGNADSATTIYLGNSNANGAFPVPFVSNKTVGNKSLFVSTTNTLIFNPSTGGLSAKNFIGNLTGNADSATKLATARTIWGQSFDGTKDVTGAITVDGDATFANKVIIGGISLRKVDNHLYLDSSLVLSGGVTMYGDDGTTVKPIWESIPFDRTTIDWVNGKWTVVGGVGSGGIDETFLAQYLSENKYATQSWVEGSYLPKSGGTISKLGRDLLIINDTSSSTINRGAYITFTSKAGDSQVKVGYDTSTGAFFNIANSTTGKTYTVRISKDGDGVSYDNQPMLHSGNVGDYALPITGGTINGSITATSFIGNFTGNADSANVISKTYLDESINYNRTESKIRLIASRSVNSEELGYPARYSTGLSVVSSYAGWQMVSYGSHTKYNPYYRSVSDSNVWGDWKQIAFTSDIPTKLSQFTDDVVTGKYLPLSGDTMTGSITTRSSVYSWANAKTVGHIIAGHNAGGSTAPIVSTALASGGYGKLAQVSDQFGLYAYSVSDSTPSVRFALYPEDGEIRIMGNTIPMSTTTYNLGSASAKWSNVYATSFIGSLTGNADSATTIYLGNSNANGAFPVPFVSNKTVGNKSLFVSTINTLIFDPSTGSLSAKNFIGNLTGNADSATNASNLTQTTYTGDVNADDLYGSKSRVLKLSTNANLPEGMNYGNILYIGGGDTGFMLAGSYSRDKLLFRRGINKNNAAQNIHTNSWKEIAFTDSNVASATKLANKVSLWGNDFDGTASISGDLILPNNNSICVKSSGGVSYSVLKMSTANSLSIGQESASNGRTTMIYGNLIRLRCGTGGTDALYVNASGNVTIGASDLAGATNKMYVDGDATFSSKVVIGTIPIYQLVDGTLFVDANVVFSGGVVMYGNTTTINEE